MKVYKVHYKTTFSPVYKVDYIYAKNRKSIEKYFNDRGLISSIEEIEENADIIILN